MIEQCFLRNAVIASEALHLILEFIRDLSMLVENASKKYILRSAIETQNSSVFRWKAGKQLH